MSENLYQIVNMDDLLYFLRGGKDKIINLTLVLLTTEEEVKRMIKKFVKRKSEQFQGATFLYYAVRKQDFKKISFLTDNVDEYPKMCHIFNINELLSEVRAIDNTEILERSFQHPDIAQYYTRFGTIARKPTSNVFMEDENGYDDDENYEEESDNDNMADMSNGSTKQIPVNKNLQGPTQVYQQQNPVLEKKKLLEKLSLIRQKGEEYNMQFLEECRKRKKEEEKLKDKEEKQSKKKSK